VAHEEELAALLAHEIAHVQHRHVAANLGRGLTVALLLSVVSTDAGAAVAQGLLGQVAQLALLGYSREQERQADEAALRASAALYGHVGGALALMQRLADLEQQRGSADGPAWWRSHPHGQDRVTAARQQAQARGWALQGELRALAPVLRPPALPPEKKLPQP
jgi:predicted Zn-dependent protease